MKRMLQTWSLSFPEVDFLVSQFAKPLLYGCTYTRLRKSLHHAIFLFFPIGSCLGIMNNTWTNDLKSIAPSATTIYAKQHRYKA